MIKIPKPDPIKYLLMRKFDRYAVNYALNCLEDRLSDDAPPPSPPDEVLVTIRAEFEALQALPVDELDRHYSKARQIDAEAAEKKLWFNQHSAKADFRFWARASYWTLDEGMMLLVGRDPRIVSWDKLRDHRFTSAFGRALSDARELGRRAVAMKQVAETNIPGFFLAWAKRVKIEIDPDLEAALEEHGVQISDWQSIYKAQTELVNQQEKTISVQCAALNKQKSTIDTLLLNKEDLLNQIEKNKERKNNGNSLSVKERESLLKLVIGMAVKGYTFDPRKSRNDATGDIAGDLAQLGISLDQDTILKWLRQGADMLPPDSLDP